MGLPVLIATAEYPPYTTGGLGTHLSLLVSSFAKRGFEVDVLLPGLAGPTFPEATETESWRADGAMIHRVPASAKTRSYSKFRPEYRDGYLADVKEFALSARGLRPKIVHCHDWHMFNIAQAIARAAEAKLVVTIHLLHHPTFGYWGQRLPSEVVRREGNACKEADAVIGVSESIRSLILETHGGPPERVHAIHNGVEMAGDDTTDLDALRRELDLEGAKVILFAGRVTAQKGVLPLLRSAAKVVRSVPEARFLVVGPMVEPLGALTGLGAEIDALLAGDELLRDRVRRTGMLPRERLRALYRLADVAVVPSIYEPFGYAAAEAMVAGVPVVATATGGLSEIVVDGVTGRLCPVNATPGGIHEVDVDALAAAQIELLRDPARAKSMGDAGKLRVRESFTVDRMVDRTLDVYSRLLA